jgi:hypothetical protein
MEVWSLRLRLEAVRRHQHRLCASGDLSSDDEVEGVGERVIGLTPACILSASGGEGEEGGGITRGHWQSLFFSQSLSSVRNGGMFWALRACDGEEKEGEVEAELRGGGVALAFLMAPWWCAREERGTIWSKRRGCIGKLHEATRRAAFLPLAATASESDGTPIFCQCGQAL